MATIKYKYGIISKLGMYAYGYSNNKKETKQLDLNGEIFLNEIDDEDEDKIN